VPLLTQAVACLSEHLPVTDVAQVELSLTGAPAALVERIREYHARAEPLLRQAQSGDGPAGGAGGGRTPGRGASADPTFLLIPASEAGKSFGESGLDSVRPAAGERAGRPT